MAERVAYKKKKRGDEDEEEEEDARRAAKHSTHRPDGEPQEATYSAGQFVRVLGTVKQEFLTEKYVRADRFEDLEKIERDEFPDWIDKRETRDELWTAAVKRDVFIIADDKDALALISERPSPVAAAIRELAQTIAYLPGVGTEYAAAKESFECKVE